MTNQLVKQSLRRETGLVELVCKHGVGHPAYGSVDYMQKRFGSDMSIHGCDGCCGSPEWQLEDLRAGVEIGNDLIIHAHNVIEELFDDEELAEARLEAERWRRRAAALREALEPSNGEIAVSMIENNRFSWEETDE